MSVQLTQEQLAVNAGVSISTKAELTRTRILDAAIALFGNTGTPSASIVEVAQRAGLTSQAVYRYFRNKDDLFHAAVEKDLSDLIFGCLKTVSQLPAPILSGAYWETFVARIDQHPLAVNSINTRNPEVLRILSECEATALFKEALAIDVAGGIEHKFMRQDVDPVMLGASAGYIAVEISIPLIMAGKYNSDDWFSIQATTLAAGFYPVPNFQDLDVAAEFQGKIIALGTNKALINYKFD